MTTVCDHPFDALLQCMGERFHGLDARADGSVVPPLEPPSSLGGGGIIPQFLESVAENVSSQQSLVGIQQCFQARGLVVDEVVAVLQQEELRSFHQPALLFCLAAVCLVHADAVDHLVVVELDHVEEVPDDLGVGQALADGFFVWPPPVHRNGFDALADFPAEDFLEDVHDGLLIVPCTYPGDAIAVAVQKDRGIVVTPSYGKLVDGQVSNPRKIGRVQSLFEGFLIDVLDQVPAQIELVRHALHAAFFPARPGYGVGQPFRVPPAGGDPIQLLGRYPALRAIDTKAGHKQRHLLPRPPGKIPDKAVCNVIVRYEGPPAGAAEVPVYPRQLHHDFLDSFIVIRRLAALIEEVEIAGLMIWNSDEPCDRMFLHVLASSEGILEIQFQQLSMHVLSFQGLTHSRAGRSSFSHLLYIEYLVAEELKTLPLPRQRQLLDSSLSHCYGRVRTSFRGIASFLTYSSDQFRYQVLKHDPVTLFVSDSGNLPIAEVDELVRAVVRNCIAHHLTPWTELRPHGYRYGFYLPRWRPADPGAVVRGLMSQPESDAKGWAASCARAWGVTATFAAEFARVALDESAPLWVRRVMIEAVGDSKSQETALSIRPLCSHSNDVLRIHAIEVVCENCELSPEESLGFYLTPATDRHYRDMYADYARKLGRNLACRDAFASAIVFISERFKEMKDFWQDLVLGPLEKARDASYDNVPPHLLYQILGSWNDEVTEELKLAATDLLRSSTQLLFRLWQYVLEGIADSTTDIYSHQIKNTFAELMTPELLPEIGKIGPDAHRYQALMVREVLQAWLGLEPTAHRLAFIQSTFPRFVSEIRLPRPLQRPCVDIPALESTIEGIAADVTATTDLQDVAGRISDIRRLTKAERAKIDHLPRRLDESSNESGIDEITASLYAQFTDDLRTGIRNLCLTTILRIIEELEHDSRKTTLAMLDETVRLHYEAGGSLPADGSDLAKVVMWSRAGESFYRARLAELRTNNVQLWQESVCQMMETPCGAEHALVQAMIQGNDPFYAERALDRLRRGELDAPVEYELIELVAHFLPDGTRELLRSYSLGLKPVPEQGALKRNSGDLALRVLLASDDDTAWEVIEAMLEGGECPLVDDWHHDFTIAPHRERVPVLCKWMVALLRDRQSGHALGLLEKMKAAIRSIGGREAVLAWIFHGP